MSCERQLLRMSPRWARERIGGASKALALSVLCLGAEVLAITTGSAWWVHVVVGSVLGVSFVVGLYYVTERHTPLSMPPLRWRLGARRLSESEIRESLEWVEVYSAERGETERSVRLRCPGCGQVSELPNERGLYRCRQVEFELRDGWLWVAPAHELSETVDPIVGASMPPTMLGPDGAAVGVASPAAMRWEASPPRSTAATLSSVASSRAPTSDA